MRAAFGGVSLSAELAAEERQDWTWGGRGRGGTRLRHSQKDFKLTDGRTDERTDRDGTTAYRQADC